MQYYPSIQDDAQPLGEKEDRIMLWLIVIVSIPTTTGTDDKGFVPPLNTVEKGTFGILYLRGR